MRSEQSSPYRFRRIGVPLRPFVATLGLIVWGLLSHVAGAAEPTADAPSAELAPIEQLLQRHCLECHGPDAAEGKFRVDRLSDQFTDSENAANWIEVRDRINLGEMPPKDETPLTVEQIKSVSHFVSTQLRDVEKARLGTAGGLPMRRLNRHEYTNTIADLLFMRFPTGESPLDVLPPDGTAEGFDKVGAALLLDPSLMEQYYEIARKIAERAIVDGPPKHPTETMRLEFEDIAESGAISYLMTRLGMQPAPGGLQLIQGSTRSFGMLKYPGRKDNNVAPENGFYRFTVRAGGHRGSDGTVPRILLTQSHPDETMKHIMEVDVDAPWDHPREYSVVIPRDALGGELHVQLVNESDLYMGQRPGENFFRRNREVGEAGDFAETIRLSGRKVAEGWGGDRSTPDPEKLDLTQFPRVFLDYLEVEGPLYEQWPPKSHTALLFRGDDAMAENAAANLDYAREIFARFLPRAWRRPVAPAELEPIVRVVETELKHGGTFHQAIRVGLTAALCSPKFLYVHSGNSPEAPPSQYDLACRLSYFLWSSMPDEELFSLAESGTLDDPQTLIAQTDRMLASEKSQRFIEGFASQWLRTESFLSFTPDKYLYKSYDEKLAEAVVREPLEFFHTLLRDDLSSLNFLNSDFVVINERLAKHYGIEGVSGETFRKVPVPEGSPRGGLLAMAGVHQAGSDGVRTKPVSRAVYVREVLFNDPPDPPPPNAGEIEPNVDGEKLTVRQRLIAHQQIEACAACHRTLDPYGLALENFNVIGAWREQQDGEDFRGRNAPTIDASGQLPDGTRFEDFEQFRSRLAAQKDRFRRGLSEKMLTYAMGRPVLPSDDSLLQHCTAEMASADDTLRALIHSIVTSTVFRQP